MNKAKTEIFGGRRARVAVFVTLSLVLLSGFFILSTATAMPTRKEAEPIEYTVTDFGEFKATEFYTTSGLLTGGIASGDADNDGDEEIIVVSWNGRVTMLGHDPGTNTWDAQIIYVDKDDNDEPFPILDVLIGDVWSQHDGNEVLFVGYSGNARLMYYEDEQWKNKVIYSTETDLFGVAYGDFDPNNAGIEIVLVDWTTNFTTFLYEQPNGSFTSDQHWAEDVLVNVMVGDFDPFRTGEEILCTSNAGYLIEVWWNGTGWESEKIWHDVNIDGGNVLLSNSAFGDFCSYHDGTEICTVGLSGNATMHYATAEGEWYHEILWQSRKNDEVKGIEGLDVGEFNPDHPGDEALLVGYSNVAVMIVDDGTQMAAENVWDTENPIEFELNGASIGNYLTNHPGGEGIVIGYSGTLTIIEYVYESIDIELVDRTTGPNLEKLQGSLGNIALAVTSRGDFTGDVTVEVAETIMFTQGDPKRTTPTEVTDPGVTVTMEPGTGNLDLSEEKYFYANVAIDEDAEVGNYTFTIVTKSVDNASITDSIEIWVRVLDLKVVDFDLKFTLGDNILLNATGNTTVTYVVQALSEYEIDAIKLQMQGLPTDVSVEFSPDTIKPGETSVMTFTIGPEAPIRTGYNNYTLVASVGGVSKTWIVPILIDETPQGIDVYGFDVITDPMGLLDSKATITVTATVANLGDDWAHFTLYLVVDGKRVKETVDQLDVGETKTYTFTYGLSPGEHNISVEAQASDDMDSNFAIVQDETYGTVDVPTGSGPAIFLAVGFLLLAVIIFFVILGIYIFGARQAGKDEEEEEEEDKGRKGRRGKAKDEEAPSSRRGRGRRGKEEASDDKGSRSRGRGRSSRSEDSSSSRRKGRGWS